MGKNKQNLWQNVSQSSLGIDYAGGTILLLSLLMASLGIWYRLLGSISINTVASPKQEIFYWITIMFSQNLGTALGDWTIDFNRIVIWCMVGFPSGIARF